MWNGIQIDHLFILTYNKELFSKPLCMGINKMHLLNELRLRNEVRFFFSHIKGKQSKNNFLNFSLSFKSGLPEEINIRFCFNLLGIAKAVIVRQRKTKERMKNFSFKKGIPIIILAAIVCKENFLFQISIRLVQK